MGGWTGEGKDTILWDGNIGAKLFLGTQKGANILDDNEEIKFGKGGLSGNLKCDSKIYSDGTETFWQIESVQGFGTNPYIKPSYFNVNTLIAPLYLPILTGGIGAAEGILLFSNGVIVTSQVGGINPYIIWMHRDYENTPRTFAINFLEDDCSLVVTSDKADLVTAEFYFQHEGDVHFGIDNMKALFGAESDASIKYDGTDLILNSHEVGTGHIVLDSVKTTTGDPAGVEGKIYWNTTDNVIKMYADGGWRTLASW